MSLRSEPSPAKRTTTTPPGSAPTTTPSPKAACTTSSPTWKTAPPASPPKPSPPPPLAPPRPQAAHDAWRGLVGQLPWDLVDEARPHAERVGPEGVAPPRVGEREVAHRPGDPDVGQAALLLQPALVE